MKHEPRPAIHMEKQFGWAKKLGGAESLGISKAGQTMLSRLVESQVWLQLAGYVLRGFRKRTIASACLDAIYFVFSLCTTGAFQATVLVLEFRESESQ